MSTYNNGITNYGYVILPKEYIESTTFTWDPGVVDKVPHEQFRMSNVSRIGCRRDTILLTLWLIKYGAKSSWISNARAIRFGSSNYVSIVAETQVDTEDFEGNIHLARGKYINGREFHEMMRNKRWALVWMLLKVEEPVFISHDEGYKFKRWRFPSYNITVNGMWFLFLSEASIYEDINRYAICEIDFHCDKLGAKWTDCFGYPDYMVFSTGKQLSLLQKSPYSEWAHEMTILVFDPGGNGRIKDVHCARLHFLTEPSLLGKFPYIFTLTKIIWIYDPGGIRRIGECHRYWSCLPKCILKPIVFSSKYVLLLLLPTLVVILEDKNRFKRRVLIRSKIRLMGSLVIFPFVSYSPRQCRLYKYIGCHFIIIN